MIRTRHEMETMLKEIESLKIDWANYFKENKMSMKDNAEALRNYTALRGAEKTLRWCLGDQESPLW